MNEKTENIKYCFLLGTHTMMFCVGFGYATSYLQNLNVPDGAIGISISVFALLGALFQFILGRVADKSSRWNFKNLIILLASIQLASSLALPFLTSFSVISTILFGLVLLLTYSMLPLLNSVSFFYAACNLKVDFGIARGVGSMAYGVISIILGKAVTSFGTGCIPFFAAAVALALLIEASLLPSPAGYTIAKNKPENDVNTNSTLSNDAPAETHDNSDRKKQRPLIFRYPAFMLMIFGVTVVMVFHNMNITYLVRIIEKTGGNSTNLGIALGISAVMEIPSLLFYGKLSKHAPSRILLLISCGVFSLKALLFCVAGNVTAVYLIQGLSIGAFGLLAASKVYYAHDTFEEKDIVTGQALVSMTEAVGMVMGSFFGGRIINASGINGVLWGGFVICATGTAFAALGAFKKQHKKS